MKRIYTDKYSAFELDDKGEKRRLTIDEVVKKHNKLIDERYFRADMGKAEDGAADRTEEV